MVCEQLSQFEGCPPSESWDVFIPLPSTQLGAFSSLVDLCILNFHPFNVMRVGFVKVKIKLSFFLECEEERTQHKAEKQP